MIYFFGDLRQLRKFELARPTISRPMPMPISSPLPPGHHSLFIPSRRAPPVPEKSVGPVPPPSLPLNSPISFVAPIPPHSQFSTSSLARTSCDSYESDVCPSVEIDISPAFFDDVPAPEGPATASCLHRPEYRLPPPSVTYLEPAHARSEARSRGLTIRPPAANIPVMVDSSQASTRSPRSMRSGSDYGPTAGFIPNGYSDNSTASLSETVRSLRSQRSACYFDFDTLPPNTVRAGHRHRHRYRHDSMSGADIVSVRTNANGLPSSAAFGLEPPSPHGSAPTFSPTFGGVNHFLGRAQYKCNQRMSATATSTSPASPPWDRSTFSETSSIRSTRRFRYWFSTLIPSFTAGVPAFAAPLTQIQSPAVKRVQWEVVVWAAFLAALIAGTLTGLVVGLVP